MARSNNNGSGSAVVMDAVSELASMWGDVPSLNKRDEVVKAMKEIGKPCLISYALSSDGQFKPITYKMSDSEKIDVLSSRRWPETVKEVMNLEGFADDKFPESAVRAMRLKMGSMVLYGDTVWEILCDEREDVRVSMGSSPTPSQASSRVSTPAVTPPSVPVNPRKRLPGEGFKEHMARLKAMDAESHARANGTVPNGGSIATMPTTATPAPTRGRSASRTPATLQGAIVAAGGTIPEPTAGRKAKEEFKVASHGSKGEVLAALLSDILSEEDVREIVREEIGKALSLLMSYYPVKGTVSEE